MAPRPRIEDPTVALVGDSHSALGWATRVARTAAADGIHRLLQLGDLGFWPKFRGGQHFLDNLDRELRASGSELWFVRGNHEDHATLLALPADEDGLVPVRPHIRFIADGTLIDWAGRRVLAVGGAPSIDRDARVLGVDWFPEEVTTDRGFDAAAAAGVVDVVVAHDCPAGIDLGELSAWLPGDAHRERMAKIADATTPKVWAHGHYHRRRTAEGEYGGTLCRVESVASNMQHGSVIYLHHDDLSVSLPSAKIRRTVPTPREW